MVVNEYASKQILSGIIILFLIILSIFILKPIAISIIIAALLAFTFAPVYDWLYKRTKAKNLSAILIVLFLIVIIILPIWFLTPILINQAIEIFQLTHKIDFTGIIQSIFPSLFSSERFTIEIGSIFSTFTTKIAGNAVDYFTQLILNFPVVMLHLLIVFFTFFFLLREKEPVIAYVKSLLPFSKEIEEKIFKYSAGITSSLIYGQIIIGIIQGVVLGIGLFIFRIPNALFLTLLSILAGILPIVGTSIIWIPLVIYLFVTGSPTIVSIGILVFGSISSTVDNFLRPMIVSRKTKIHSAILLISMIGGLFFFGILGLILGPLIISYLLIFLEIYRGKSKPAIILSEDSK